MENGRSKAPPGAQCPEKHTVISFFLENRFFLLLIFLLVLIILGPLFRYYLDTYVGDYTENFLFLVVLLLSLRSVGHTRGLFLCSLITVLFCIAASACNFFLQSIELTVAIYGVESIFVAVICGVIIWHILRQKRVDANTIMGGVCVYLLLGVLWAFLYVILEFLIPGSFLLTYGDKAYLTGELFGPLWYFSYATLTTTGFGDIIPVSDTAQGLVILESIAGQVFLVVFIAGLLGLHIAGRGHLSVEIPKE